jgi:type IX secretion system substrate protein/beta-propeller repeat-containing protein
MKKNLYCFLAAAALVFCSLHTNAQSGWQWGLAPDTANNPGADVWASAIDGSANVINGGSSFGTIGYTVYGADTLYFPTAIEQAVVTKSDSGGHFIWARGSQHSPSRPAAVTGDLTGNVYVLGSFFDSSSITFMPYTLLNTARTSYFLVKYSPAGTVLWAKAIAVYNNRAALGGGIGVDGANNVYITGSFYLRSINIGGITLTNTNPGGDTGDVFIAKYDSLGNTIWARSFGGQFVESPTAMTVSPAGNLYITGTFNSRTMTIGSTVLSDTLLTRGFPQKIPFITKFDSSGNAKWADEITGVADIWNITSDATEHIYIVGDLYTNLIVGPDTLINAGVVNVLLAKYDTYGSVVWAKSVGGKYTDIGYSIAVDSKNNILVAGDAESAVMHFGSDSLLTWGSFEAFVAEFDNSGTYKQGWTVTSAGDDYIGVVADKAGSFYLNGDYAGVSLSFGPDILDTPVGSIEALFVAKYRYDTSFDEHGGVPLAIIPGATGGAQITLFPNPTQNELMITAPYTITRVAISNMLGQTVYTRAYNADQVQVDVAGLPTGVYFVKINDIEVRKFVKG